MAAIATTAPAATTTLLRPPLRFKPLNPAQSGDDKARILKGVVFDVDGTLCKPQSYMFREMRSVLQISPETDILEHIYGLSEDDGEGQIEAGDGRDGKGGEERGKVEREGKGKGAQQRAFSAIRAIEAKAMGDQEPQPGVDELLGYLSKKGVRMGLCTRNFDGPVTHLLTKFLPSYTFDPIITRAFRPPKPSPAGILHIAAEWGVLGEEMVMVGDSLDDMTAGYGAGAATVLLVGGGNEGLKEHEHTGLWINRLDELVGILEGGLVEKKKEKEKELIKE